MVCPVPRETDGKVLGLGCEKMSIRVYNRAEF